MVRVLLWTSLLFCAVLHGEETIRLATTTSLAESGIVEAFATAFTKETGIRVRVFSVGSGAAFALGKNGDADLLLVHAPDDEEFFVAGGYGVEHRPIMYNEFVIVGPKHDPAGFRGAPTAIEAFRRIAARGAVVVSRGDRSGTHRFEEKLWRESGVSSPAERCRYLSVGQGMSATLRIADEREGYTLVDNATFEMLRCTVSLEVLVSGDPLLRNRYAAILVRPSNRDSRSFSAAKRFMAWLSSPRCRALIEQFSVHGVKVFTPLPER